MKKCGKKIRDDSDFCSGCGVCEAYACPQGLSPRALLNATKNRLRASNIALPEFTGEVTPIKDRDIKRVPLKRLRARLGLEKYNNPAPIYEDPINGYRLYARNDLYSEKERKQYTKIFESYSFLIPL